VLRAFADKQEDGKKKTCIMRNYTIYTPNITMAMKSVING
jgi:hypothetical protein